MMFRCISKELPVQVTPAAFPLEALGKVFMQRFDLALVDYQLGTYTGDLLIRELLEIQSSLIAIGISMMDHPAFVKSVMEAGAAGFLLKTFTPDQLLQAIRIVFLGQDYYDAEIEKVLLAWEGKKGRL